MTVYYAFKPSEGLREQISTLLSNLDAGVSAPQHALHTQLSVILTDEVMEHLLMTLVNAMKGKEGAGILSTLAGLLKSTVHVLIKQLLGKHDNAEVNKMAQYLRDKSLTLNGEARFGFALPDELGNRFVGLLQKTAAGDGVAHKAELVKAMTEFVDLAIANLYDDFTKPMDLGFIKRKAVELGRSTISKGSHSAISKLFPQLGAEELKAFGAIYSEMIVQA